MRWHSVVNPILTIAPGIQLPIIGCFPARGHPPGLEPRHEAISSPDYGLCTSPSECWQRAIRVEETLAMGSIAEYSHMCGHPCPARSDTPPHDLRAVSLMSKGCDDNNTLQNTPRDCETVGYGSTSSRTGIHVEALLLTSPRCQAASVMVAYRFPHGNVISED